MEKEKLAAAVATVAAAIREYNEETGGDLTQMSVFSDQSGTFRDEQSDTDIFRFHNAQDAAENMANALCPPLSDLKILAGDHPDNGSCPRCRAYQRLKAHLSKESE